MRWLAHATMLLTALTAACLRPSAPPLLDRAVRQELPPRAVVSPPATDTRRAEVVRFATTLLDGAPLVAGGVEFSPDPVGFVRACFWSAGIELYDEAVAAETGADAMQILFRSAAKNGWLHAESPRPGDLAFFDPDTRGNALNPTQVAVVERIDEHGTFTTLGAFAHGPERVYVNLREPERTTAADGRKLNDLFAGDEQLTAAAVFRGFADPFRGR